MLNDLERALNEKRAPWTEIEYRTKDYWVFRDAYPVTDGHLLFVPTYEKSFNLEKCFQAAYKFGYDGWQADKWDGFNIGQNCGEAAGQTVMYPHVHMIPRRFGDMENPRGGVRHVIPEKGNYKMQVRVPEEGKKLGTCGCGRSPTGDCIGWHGLSEEEFEHRKELYETGKADLNGKPV